MAGNTLPRPHPQPLPPVNSRKGRSTFYGITLKGIYGHRWKHFFRDLKKEIVDDNLLNGSASLAYYLVFAIFPAMIFLLGVIPYLPIENIQGAVMGWLNEMLPGDAAQMFTSTVQDVTSQKKGGLLSIGALITLWSATSGMHSIMQHLNITYDVTESRHYLKVRGIALLLTLLFGSLIITAFGLIVVGGLLQSWLGEQLDLGQSLLVSFSIIRWVIIGAALTLGFALIYYFAPDVDQKFRFVTPGSFIGVFAVALASVVFKIYVENFGKYSASYGAIGAMIVLMLWLNIIGIVLLVGSEINALIEHYSPEGKDKGEKTPNEITSRGVAMHSPKTEGKSMSLINNATHRSPETTVKDSLKDVSSAMKDLVQSEVVLIKTEIRESTLYLGRYVAQAASFGALVGLSALPFLAFLVIGLGRLIGERYWLSALIISLTCAVLGGAFVYRAYKKIKTYNLTLPRSREALERGKATVTESAEDVKDAALGRTA